MKSTYLFCVALAMLLFTSCEKETQQDFLADAQGVDGAKYTVTENIETSQLGNFQMKLGEVYQVRDHPDLLDFFVNELGVNVDDFDSPETSRGKRSIAHRFVFVDFIDNCTGPAENCPELGQELQGYKSGAGYLQIAAASSSNPFARMLYKYDPKPLKNFSDDYNYHYYKHINFNDVGSINVTFYCYDDSLNAWSVDVDNMSISDYGQHTFFEVWSEVETFATYHTNENAVQWAYSSCCY